MHIIVPLPYPRRNANNCYGPIESNSSPPSRGHSTSALNKLQQFSPSPSPTRSLPQFVSNERGSSFCPAAHVQCHLSYATPHPTPHAQRPEKPARFTPGYRFNFDQFWQRYEIDCPTFVQPIEPESPRIHPSRIEIFDRLIFHPDRARRMRAPRFALDRCRQFCCIR